MLLRLSTIKVNMCPPGQYRDSLFGCLDCASKCGQNETEIVACTDTTNRKCECKKNYSRRHPSDSFCILNPTTKRQIRRLTSSKTTLRKPKSTSWTKQTTGLPLSTGEAVMTTRAATTRLKIPDILDEPSPPVSPVKENPAQTSLNTIVGLSIGGIFTVVLMVIIVGMYRSRQKRYGRTPDVVKDSTEIIISEDSGNDNQEPLPMQGQAFGLHLLNQKNWAFNSVADWGTLRHINSETKPITIAIVDSGVQMNHPYLTEWEPQFIQHISCINDNRPGAAKKDPYGHGTFIAGIFCHMLSEVRPFVRIINIKAINDSGELHIESFWRAMDQLSRINDLDLVCLALGFKETPEWRTEDRNMLTELSNRTAMIAAASNYGVPDPDNIAWPARKLMAVGSHNKDFRCSSFSPQGQSLHVLAPGEELQSLNASFTVNGPSGLTRKDSGTSFATAYATGVAAHFLLQVAARVPENPDIRRQMTSTDMMKAVMRHMARDSQHSVGEGYGPLRPLSAFSNDNAFRNLVHLAKTQP